MQQAAVSNYTIMGILIQCFCGDWRQIKETSKIDFAEVHVYSCIHEHGGGAGVLMTGSLIGVYYLQVGLD